MSVATQDAPTLRWNIGDQSPVVDLNMAWTGYIPVKPTPHQTAFLMLPCREALYGGAGGGGKSIALLMAALQYVDTPGYAALIIRKSYADLSLPGALMEVSQDWLANSDAKWVDVEKTWKFPIGSSMTFGYLDGPRDKYRYQSAMFQYIGVDELTQFPEMDYTYLFSRTRRLKGSEIPIRMRSASNPGNVGHEWVKKRFMDSEGADRIFLSAKVADNPYLDVDDYRKSLAELDPITRLQIENGDWTARHGGNKFRREWFGIVDAAPVEMRTVRFWDMAATEPKAGRDPDWSVGLLLGISSDNIIYVLDIQRMRGTPNSTEKRIVQTAEIDGKVTMIRMEQEPGSSGVKAIDDYKRRVLMGYDFKGIPSTGSKDVRANPVASQAEAGNVKLVRGKWIEPFLDEVELFPAGSHDDQVDALSGALNALTTASKEFMIG